MLMLPALWPYLPWPASPFLYTGTIARPEALLPLSKSLGAPLAVGVLITVGEYCEFGKRTEGNSYAAVICTKLYSFLWV